MNNLLRQMKNMKKTKMAVLFAAAMAMVGFTSCLNGEVNTTVQGAPILKAESGYMETGLYFVDAWGTKYKPTKTVMMKESEFAQVPMQYDSSLLNEQNNSYDVTLLGDPVFLNEYVANPIEIPTGETTATMEVIHDDYLAKGAIWGIDNDYLLLPVGYYLHEDVDVQDKDELKAELAKHKFMVYSPAGKNISSTGDSLKLSIRHTIMGVSLDNENAIKTYEEEYNQGFSEWVYIPTRYLLNSIKNELGEEAVNKLKYFRIEFEAMDDYSSKTTIDPEKKKVEVRSYELYKKQDM